MEKLYHSNRSSLLRFAANRVTKRTGRTTRCCHTRSHTISLTSLSSHLSITEVAGFVLALALLLRLQCDPTHVIPGGQTHH